MDLSELTAYAGEKNQNSHGCTIVLEPQRPVRETGYQETALPFAESRRSAKEQLPEKLREMRRLFEYGRESVEFRAQNFYRQAVFMQDYEDDCPWSGGEFFRYFATYHDLTVGQLRGYFTWRTGVRKGEFTPIPTSAAYIYLYELLNGVGADSPEDALKKLRAFETGYLDSGIGDQRMRSNLHRWMLEYAVVNGLPPEVVREYADLEIMERDGAIAVLQRPEECPDESVFSALCVFGGKKLAESPVIRTGPERGKHLFAEAWRAACRPQDNALSALCFGEKKTRRWYPLSNAVCYRQKKPEDRDCILSECRSYRCRDGIWTVRAFESLSYDKARMQGFLHEADARLRRYLKTGRYLKERQEEAWAVSFIDAAVEADRKEAAEAARPKITIDLAGLEEIRRDALMTRDSLLTEEDLAGFEEAVTTPAEEPVSELPPESAEIRILRALLRGEDAAGILKACHLMPTMAADSINEAFFDEIGDTVLLCEDDKLLLVDDYIEELEQIVGGTNHGST